MYWLQDFYPLLLKGKENYLPRLCPHTDKFKHFGMFSDYFIVELKKEIKFLVKTANEPFDWSGPGKITQYQTQSNKRIQAERWLYI